jgi:hypothetical protein
MIGGSVERRMRMRRRKGGAREKERNLIENSDDIRWAHSIIVFREG